MYLIPFLSLLDLANNKIKTISGLKGLTQLRKIDLGANRIRVMDEDELSGLVNLEELWLGKNKIEEIRGLDKVGGHAVCVCCGLSLGIGSHSALTDVIAYETAQTRCPIESLDPSHQSIYAGGYAGRTLPGAQWHQ